MQVCKLRSDGRLTARRNRKGKKRKRGKEKGKGLVVPCCRRGRSPQKEIRPPADGGC